VHRGTAAPRISGGGIAKATPQPCSPTGALRVLLESKVHGQVYPPMAVNCTKLTEVPQVAQGYARLSQISRI
jgi:hypothetical protein